MLRNVTFPLELTGVGVEERNKKLRELLSLVDLLDKEKAYPAKLSGGQKQRVDIVRALESKSIIIWWHYSYNYSPNECNRKTLW